MNFLARLNETFKGIVATDHLGAIMDFDVAIQRVTQWAIEYHSDGGRLFFVGNGGSAAIASHMAIDWTKNCGLRGMCFNDSASLTCLGNDLGYEQVFAHQIEKHAHNNDTLFAISSSGKSENIRTAIRAASGLVSKIVTLTGFSNANPIREMGHLNFYVPSYDYGVVECSHLAICHAMVNQALGRGL